MITSRTTEAYEILGSTETTPIVLCCEHASNANPDGWGADRSLSDTHWAWDPGAAEVTRQLSAAWGSAAVLAGYSRLLVDANRPLYSRTLFRDEADGSPVHMNLDLPDPHRLERIRRWWQPYHGALDEVCRGSGASMLLSIHSFTRQYADHPPRSVEIGVLFENHDALAERIRDGLVRVTRRDVRGNEPYSGKGGMMYSCYSHARNNGMQAIEIELRQDLLADTQTRNELVDAILRVVPEALARGGR